MSPDETARYDAHWKQNVPGYYTPKAKITHYNDHDEAIEKSTVIYNKFGRQKRKVQLLALSCVKINKMHFLK